MLRPSVSEISVTLRRFGRNLRFVLMLEWLTLWPTSGLLPVRSQRQDMAHSSKNNARRRAVQVNRPGKDRGRIESEVAGVKPSHSPTTEVFQASCGRTQNRPNPDRRDECVAVNSAICERIAGR